MRTFVLLCAALAVLQTVTAMTGPEGHTTDESGGPPAGWPDNKEDCENMEGGFWQEDRHRCESESMCNQHGGQWTGSRCEFEEGHHSTTAYPGHHSSTAYPGHHSSTAYPGHHSSTAYPGHHSTTSEPYYTPSEKCAKSGGIWRWDGPDGWCDHSGTSHATTAAPHHHSTTISYWEQRARECTMHGGKWHWHGADYGICEHSATTTANPNGYWEQRARECTMHGGKWHWDGHNGYCEHSATTTANPNSYWEQRKHECDSSGGSWHWDGHQGWCDHHSTTAHPGHHWTTPYPGHTGHHTTTAHPGHHSTTAYPHTTTEHYGDDCEADQCCGDGTQFENGVCVPTYEGVMDACREERKEWGWTCETSCPADGANGDI
jgi:hypothetical protein